MGLWEVGAVVLQRREIEGADEDDSHLPGNFAKALNVIMQGADCRLAALSTCSP